MTRIEQPAQAAAGSDEIREAILDRVLCTAEVVILDPKVKTINDLRELIATEVDDESQIDEHLRAIVEQISDQNALGVDFVLHRLATVERFKDEGDMFDENYLELAFLDIPVEILVLRASNYYAEGQKRLALIAHRALLVRMEELNFKTRMTCLYRTAEIAEELGEIDEAIDCLRELYKIYTEFKHPNSTKIYIIEYRIKCLKEGITEQNPPTSIEDAVARRGELLLHTLLDWAKAAQRQKKINEHILLSEEIAQRDGLPIEMISRQYYLISRNYEAVGDLKKALDYANTRLSFLEEQGADDNEVQDTRDAVRSLERKLGYTALIIIDALNNQRLNVAELEEYSKLAREEGDAEAQIQFTSRIISHPDASEKDICKAYWILAIINNHLGRFNEALEAEKKHLEYLQLGGSSDQLIQESKNSIRIIELKLGIHNAAVKLATRRANPNSRKSTPENKDELIKRLEDPETDGMTLYNTYISLAECEERDDNNSQAVSYYKQAYEVAISFRLGTDLIQKAEIRMNKMRKRDKAPIESDPKRTSPKKTQTSGVSTRKPIQSNGKHPVASIDLEDETDLERLTSWLRGFKKLVINWSGNEDILALSETVKIPSDEQEVVTAQFEGLLGSISLEDIGDATGKPHAPNVLKRGFLGALYKGRLTPKELKAVYSVFG